MATIQHKLEHILETKMSILRAIEERLGKSLPFNSPFCEYKDSIDEINRVENTGTMLCTEKYVASDAYYNRPTIFSIDGDSIDVETYEPKKCHFSHVIEIE